MAAEAPVSDILCEAMEYLSKLGSNLRARSESLKEKRISKSKLKNAHAVHKAAQKVLLICELSKKSLENVETGVKKVLSLVDASQAPQKNIGGKNIVKTKEEDKKFYYFEYESHKLRISKKISLKHYMSAKVHARSLPVSMQDKYPVYYDCPLQRRRLSEKQKSKGEVQCSSERRKSDCSTDSSLNTEKSKENNMISAEVINKSSGIEDSEEKLIDTSETDIVRRKSFSDSEGNTIPIGSLELGTTEQTKTSEDLAVSGLIGCFANEAQIDDKPSERHCDIRDDSVSSKSKSVTKDAGRKSFSDSEGNTIPIGSLELGTTEQTKTSEDLAVSDLIGCFANEAKIDDKPSERHCDIRDDSVSSKSKSVTKDAANIRKKFRKIKIADDTSDSNEAAPVSKTLENSESKEKRRETINDSGGVSTSREDSDSEKKSIKPNNSEDEQQDSDNSSKPKIRCVNITKLLKPDILDKKIYKSSIDKEINTNKQIMKNSCINKNSKNEQEHVREDKRVIKRNKNDEENESDVEFWKQKRKIVQQFKPKQLSVSIECLPKFSDNFLLKHKINKIIQDCKIISELTNNKGEKNLHKNINEVKNALLDDSGSEEIDSTLTAEAMKVKMSLLNDSDSEKGQTTEIVDKSKKTDLQINSDKFKNDPAATKDALLNESDSETNDVAKSKTSNDDVKGNDKELEDANKIKSTLLNDSDSDKNANKEDRTTNSHQTIDKDKAENSGNKSRNVELSENKDPEKIKSSLLNDSSDSEAGSSVVQNKMKLTFFRHKRKHAMRNKQAKKTLLHYSSSSENEDSQTSEYHSKKRKRKHAKQRTHISSSSSSSEENKTVNKNTDSQDSSTQDKSDKILLENKDSKSKHQSDGGIDESSDSGISKMVRSKAKPSGSSGQNSDTQDASDKDIDGLTNLNSLNKPHRRHDSTSTNNTGSLTSKKKSRSIPTPAIGEDLLGAASSSDISEEENIVEEELPPISLSGLNGDGVVHLAKDDLLGESDSSASHDKEESGAEETNNADDSEDEENVKLKRRKANTMISSDSECGTSRLKQTDEDVRVSDFEDSEAESSESIKRSKRKKKGSDSDASGSSNDGGKKKRRRIKQVRDSDVSGSDTENEGRNKHGRKNIRKVMGKNQLEEATKKAAREEKERIARITERQKLYNNLDFDESGKPDEVVLEKVVLDFDPETKEPLIEVDRGLVKKLKPHQANGIKFMWDACFESVKRIKKDKGSGCILAHCMGLGKTLQVISLTHTLLIHGSLTGVNRVLVVCPLSTVLNWVNEFKMWLKHAHSEFEVDVYELSRYKQNSERAFQLQQWFEGGGVCVLGYEMFRNLSADNNKKFKKKMLRSFQESLVDPGPDLVVCDEGHLLKNEKTSLSQSMNRVKTRRRIVLTGTPLQNNLKEYYCMVQFVKPNLLGKYNEYLNRFVNPITNGQYTDSTEHDIKVMKRRSHVLHKMLDGAVQRRDYGVLAPFLPPKHEYVLFITLSDVQVKLYQYYLDNYSRRPLPGKSSGFLFPDFQSLQRIWTHPLVLKYNSERYEIMQQKKREREEEDSEGSLVDFIDDDSTPEETSTEESSDDLSDMSDDSRKKSKKKKSAKKSKAKDSKVGTRRGTRANPVEMEEDPDIAEVVEVKNENPTEWWIKLVEDEELEDMRNSHKLVLLFDILRQCEAIGDKLLVFSQSLYSLDLIEHFLGKVDEATQEGRIDEKLGGHVGSWSPGVDYFRLDGSTSCENRSIWCKNFNREDNPRARLFLISTRAGGLGINLVAANRVVIFDVSWNPSHDVQSIFRVYRFGQKKPCYIYRFLAMGTMEEKIYERQVTKQAISKRVIDEQQIDRHYAENDLAELYKFEARPDEPRPLPTLPKDRLFAEMLKEHEAQIYKYHEHDSLLENKEEETLSEEERKAAWEDFENEKNKPPPAPFPSTWPMHNGMVPGLLAQQQQQLAYAALAAMLRKDMPNINDNQIRDMLPLIYNSNPAMFGGYDYGLMQKMGEIYKYAQPGMMNPAMMNPVMNPAAGSGGAAGGMGGTSGLQYEPPWQRQQQQQHQMRLQQLLQQNQMGAKFYAGGLGSRDPVAMALQQQRAREIMMGGAGRPRGRPPLAPRHPPTPAQDVVNLDSD